ncbi:hypothetical protein BGZ54_005882 [Gamsiella multidivaricata]|nr:hypothetical protein BGZ54_005882 [Gamsiella multidivaricata]
MPHSVVFNWMCREYLRVLPRDTVPLTKLSNLDAAKLFAERSLSKFFLLDILPSRSSLPTLIMNHSMTSGFMPGYGTAIWSPNLMPMSEPEYIGALIGLFLLSVGFRALVAAQGYLEAYLHLHFYPRLSSSPSPGRSHPAADVDYLQQSAQPRQLSQYIADNLGEIGHEEPEYINEKRLDDPLPGQGESDMPSSLPPPQHTPLPPVRTRTRKRYGSTNRHPLVSPPTYAPSTSPLFPLPTAQPFIWQAEFSRAVLTTAVVGIGYMLMLVVMTYNSGYFGVILAGIFVGEVYFGRWGRVRPIFPASPREPRSRSHLQQSQQQHGRRQQQSLQPEITMPSAFNTNSSGSSSGIYPSTANAASASTGSLASRASSHGYSTMLHHTAADAAC